MLCEHPDRTKVEEESSGAWFKDRTHEGVPAGQAFGFFGFFGLGGRFGTLSPIGHLRFGLYG